MDRVFDRRIEFDDRSRNFPIRALIEERQLAPRSYTWGSPVRLDQGFEGACVGFSWAGELAARPKVHGLVDNDLARDIYHSAQYLDEWDDTPPAEGTSVIAGAKEMVARGYIGEYRWSFDVEDMKVAVSWFGPVVLGCYWYENMLETDSKGFVYPSGRIAGGHAIMVNGYNVTYDRFKLLNSWGNSWGLDGHCFIRGNDMADLLAEDGEACVPTVRKLIADLRQ